jgi:hypothetical protein
MDGKVKTCCRNVEIHSNTTSIMQGMITPEWESLENMYEARPN